MLCIILLVLMVGTVLDLAPTILILSPVLMPIIRTAGIDPVYFGVVFVMTTCIGLMTPPVGVVLNVVSWRQPGPLGKVIYGVWPFLASQVVVLGLLIAFPELVLCRCSTCARGKQLPTTTNLGGDDMKPLMNLSLDRAFWRQAWRCPHWQTSRPARSPCRTAWPRPTRSATASRRCANA
jgi:hypothetical protein